MVQIGPLAIRWYGVLLTLAIFLGYELARRRLRAWGWDLEPFERVVFWAVRPRFSDVALSVAF